MHDGMEAKRDNDIIGSLLSELVDYAYCHFSTEGKYFRLHQFPNFDVHKSKHDLMKGLVADLKRKYDANEGMIILEVMELLKDWLSDHVLGSDRKYGSFLNERGVI
jgi:hemerythrin